MTALVFYYYIFYTTSIAYDHYTDIYFQTYKLFIFIHISEGFPDYGQLDEFDQKHVLDWRTGLPKFFFGIPALVDTNIHLRNTLMSYGWDLLGCK